MERRSVRSGAILRLVLIAAAVCACERASLVDVFDPDLSALDPQVRERISRMRAGLDDAVTRGAGDDTTLGRMFGEAGMLYHAYGLVEAAHDCYANARVLAPEEPAWPYYAAVIERTQGHLQDAAASLRHVLALDPDHVQAQLRIAEIEFDAARFDEAEAIYEQVRDAHPDSAQALFGLGKIAARRRDYAAAVERFEAALAIAPGASEIRYPLGIAYRGLGDEARAAESIARRGNVTIADPLLERVRALREDWRADFTRGTALFEEGLFEQAAEAFRAAARAAPGEATVRSNLGATLHKLGDYEGARAELAEAVRLDPRTARAHFGLGTLAARTGDDETACSHYRAALEVDPRMLDTHFNLGNALRRLGRFAEALPHYRIVVDQDPGNATARQAEILTLIRLHRYEEAVPRAEQAVEALPDDPALRHVLVRLLAAAPVKTVRNGARALEIAGALVADERSLQHVEALAMAAAEAGRFDVAVEWQSQALAAVERVHRPDLRPGVEARLAGYRRREPCRAPWEDDDPMLAPPPLSGSQSPRE